jgi:hypothetical protein
MKINFQTLSLVLSVSLTVLTLCALQFYDLGSARHGLWEERQNHKYATFAPDNLPRTIEYLQLIDDKHRLNKVDIPLSKTEE